MKQFFISFFANLAAITFVLVGPFLLFLILIIASVSASSKMQHMVSIERGSVLVMDLSMNVTDSPEHANQANPISSALGQDDTKSVTLRSLVNALRKAAIDDRIRALFITGSFQPSGFGTGYASLKELREAIINFENTKDHKKVFAYIESPTTRDYYVDSTATTLYMNPFGEMDMPGLAIVKTYYKGLFDKYGIDVQVTRHGKYKSAVEPFILEKMSDADREETQKLIDGIWGNVISGVVSARPKIDPVAFQQLVDTDGYILPQHALDAHLIDKIGYFGDVLDELGRIAPSSDYAKIPLPFKQVAIGDYINSSHTPRLPGERGGDKEIAVLYLEGEIVDGEGDLTNIGGDRFASELRDLRKDDDVKAVVLRVNSPGGSAFASESIQHEIIALRAKKPVIVSMGNYAASGGYWISTFSDRIFAEPNTLTGSIGVFGMFMDVQKLANNNGITWDAAKTGQYADFETISRPKTDQELAIAQGRVDDLYGKFIDKVSKSRGIDPITVDSIAQGRVWTGSEALNLKLVDEIGGLNNAIDYAIAKAKISGSYHIKEYPEKVSFAETLALLFSNEEEPVSKAKVDPITSQFLKMKNDLKTLQEFNDPVGMYARMPLGWDIK